MTTANNGGGRGEPLVHQDYFARADLKPDMFDDAIRQRGYNVIWEQGLFCPCIQRENGQPDYNCPLCNGKGYIYINPKETKALVTSISGRKDQEHIGLNEQGASYLTPLSTDNVGFRDRFTFIDFKLKFSDVVDRSDTDTDILRYPCLDTIMLRNLSTIFKRGIDFDVTLEGSIKWKDSNAPLVGERYSILYTIHPVYIAINPIHELRGTNTLYKGQGQEYFVQLPGQYQIKREDMT